MSKPKNTDSKSSKNSLEQIASDLAAKKYKNVVFLVGAGISTAAGIPDFRSPGTGLYDNLEKLNLPYPEAVFDIDYFRKKPLPFYTLAKDLYPSLFKPTDFHKFMKWVEDKGMLKRVYTQNIDTLERLAGISDSKIVEAHGSFATNHCIDCKYAPEPSFVADIVLKQPKVTIPKCTKCGGIIKPDIVFFGEGLPERFFDMMDKDFNSEVDLVICAGTSLQVQPFAQLPDMAPRSCTRLLLNAEKVGSFGRRGNDVVVKCSLDDITKLMPFMGESEDKKEVTASGDNKKHEKSETETRTHAGVEKDSKSDTVKTNPAKASESTETPASPQDKASERVNDIAKKLGSLDLD